MAVTETPRFAMPMLAAAQAHKEVTHNEALLILDFLMHPAVQSIASDPSLLTPAEGQSWLVGDAAAGIWGSHEKDIACWTNGGWRFVKPTEAMTIFLEDEGCHIRFRNGNWSLPTNLTGAAGGAVQDVEARSAIDSILNLLRDVGISI